MACAAVRWLIDTLPTHLRYNLTGLLEAINALRSDLSDLCNCVSQDDVRAIQADDVAQLLNPVEELVEVHWSGQSDVTKVTRTELVGVFAGRTDLAILNDTEARVEDAVWNRLARLIGLVGGNLHDTPLEDVVGVCDAELNSGDCVAHFTSYTVLCKVFVLGKKASVAFQNASS